MFLFWGAGMEDGSIDIRTEKDECGYAHVWKHTLRLVHVCKFVFLQLAHSLEWAALFVYLPNFPDSPFVFISRIFCFIYNEINIYMLCKSSRGKLAFLIRCQIHVGIAIILHPSVLLDLFIVTANHLVSCIKGNCKAYTLSKKPVNCKTTILSDLACRMCILE